MPVAEPLLYSIEDISELTGVSVATLYRYRALGKLPAEIRLTKGAVRWRAADIKRWVELGCPCRKEFEARTGK